MTAKNIITEGLSAGKISTTGDLPTISALTASGVSAVATVEGNDTAGTITLTTGTSVASGEQLNIVFTQPLSKIPKVALTATNDNADSEDSEEDLALLTHKFKKFWKKKQGKKGESSQHQELSLRIKNPLPLRVLSKQVLGCNK